MLSDNVYYLELEMCGQRRQWELTEGLYLAVEKGSVLYTDLYFLMISLFPHHMKNTGGGSDFMFYVGV